MFNQSPSGSPTGPITNNFFGVVRVVTDDIIYAKFGDGIYKSFRFMRVTFSLSLRKSMSFLKLCSQYRTLRDSQ